MIDTVKANHTGKTEENCHLYLFIYFNTSFLIDVMELNNKLSAKKLLTS